MELTVHSVDGSHVSIADIDQSGVLEMVDARRNVDVSVLAFALDEAMTYIVKASIVRIDVD